MSFCFKYRLLPLLTSCSSDQSIKVILGSCKQQHCYCRCLVAPPSLLHAAITIMVKITLVNNITFFYFVGSGSVVVAAWWQRWWQWQHDSSG
jgi:hypothetical protein